MQSSDKDNNSIPGDTSFFIRDLHEEPYVITNIFNKIKKILGDNINLGRVYLNGQFPGRNGFFHVDDCDRTVLIYLSKWDVEWGGFTHILGENFPESKIIEPIFNRFVCFPGNLLHKAYSFSYQHCPMRISLSYKETLDNPWTKVNESIGQKVKIKIKNITEKADLIDKKISSATVGFNINEMSSVDRNSLRVAISESIIDPNLPKPIIINESIEVASCLGSDSSGSLINGILVTLLL